MTIEPHVNPAPNAQSSAVVPGRMRPRSIASSIAIGIEAEEVLPKRSTFTYTLSIGTPACFAVASMMRLFA